MNTALADAIRDRRKELGYSQHALAARSKLTDPTGRGVSPRTIAKVETGGGGSPSTLARIDRALGWPIGSCSRLANGGPAPDAHDNELADRVTHLEAVIFGLVEFFNRLAPPRRPLPPMEHHA